MHSHVVLLLVKIANTTYSLKCCFSCHSSLPVLHSQLDSHATPLNTTPNATWSRRERKKKNNPNKHKTREPNRLISKKKQKRFPRKIHPACPAILGIGKLANSEESDLESY